MKPKTFTILKYIAFVVLAFTIAILGLIISPAIAGVFIIVFVLYHFIGFTKSKTLNAARLIGLCFWLIGGIVAIFSPNVNNWTTFMLSIGIFIASIGNAQAKNQEKSTQKES